jgi:tetratricopeptide (TPR) repeat protein
MRCEVVVPTSMPGKQARVLCPVCQEPIPPDETECENCGAFVIDEAVVRLSRAFGLDRDRALKLFDAGFRHPTQLRDRDPNRVLDKGEVGLLFICTNCGGFVASGDSKCPRCAAEFEAEPESPAAVEEEDILDLVLCPVCGADNDPDLRECEICGEPLKSGVEPIVEAAPPPPVRAAAPKVPPPLKPMERADYRFRESERRVPEPARWPPTPKAPPAVIPKPAPRPMPTQPTAMPSRPPVQPPRAPVRPPEPAPLRRAPPVTRPPSRPAQTTGVRPAPPRPVARPPVAIQEKRKPFPPTRSPAAIPPRSAAPTPSGRSKPLPQKKVRESSRLQISPETFAGFVLAAGAGLLLAGTLHQRLVGAGIAGFLAALSKYIADGFRRHTLRSPGELESDVLVVGIVLGALAPFFRADAALAGISLALGSAACLAWLTRRLVRTPQRVLVAGATAVSLAFQGLVSYLDSTYATTQVWLVGILATMPWPAAVASMEILRRQNVNVLRRQVVRAEQNVERRNYEQSLAEYDRAIASTAADVPGAEVPWYGKGATLILLGRYDEALRAIDRALDINPRNEVAWVNKGNALARMGRPVDALRAFNAAIKVNALYEVAWNNKGNALARLGKLEESLRCYERALGIDPGYRGAWVNMGFVLTKMGRFDEAASCADRALRLERGRHAEPV